MTGLAVGPIRPGEYVAAQGDYMVGRIQACQWHGFRAFRLDGSELPGSFETLMAAAEVLALEFAWARSGKVKA